jgi:hypothetical protein
MTTIRKILLSCPTLLFSLGAQAQPLVIKLAMVASAEAWI